MDNFKAFFENKKIFLTGHTGFIGSWMIAALKSYGATIAGFSNSAPSDPNLYDLISNRLDLTDIAGDIRQYEVVKQEIEKFEPEIVIHLAAQPLVKTSYHNPVETFETNFMGTVNLLQAALAAKTTKVVLAMTTDKVYRNNEWVYPYRENDPLGGKDPYSASKSASEMAVESFRESFYKNRNVGLSSIRAGNVIGGGDWADNRLVPDIVRSILAGRRVTLRNPNSIRPWQHVIEPINGIFRLAVKMHESPRNYSGAWNFGPSQDPMSVEELTKTFLKLWNYDMLDINIVEESEKESNLLMLDSSKAKHELSWTTKLDMVESLKLTVNWYKQYMKSPDSASELLFSQIKEYQMC